MLKIIGSHLCDNSSYVALECITDSAHGDGKPGACGEKGSLPPGKESACSEKTGACADCSRCAGVPDVKARKTVFYILPEDYAALNPAPGVTDDATAAEICRLDEKCRALRAGRRLLEYSSNTRSGLVNKLRTKGFSKDSAAFAAARLEGDGEIDETRDIQRDAELTVKKGRGRMRVVAELRHKGYSDEAVKAVSSYLDSVDFAEVCAAVIRKKYKSFPSDPDERRKAVASLMRLGFSSRDITAAVKK